MKRCFTLLAALLVLVLGARPAYAWDNFGHKLVARIAWENMTPLARSRAIAILRAAQPETGLQGTVTGTLGPQQQIDLFVFAATWPDEVRDTSNATNMLRSEKYHHQYRHYVDNFWRQDTDFGAFQAVDRRPEGDLIRDMPLMQRWLATGTPALKAIGLAWILHLVGDIHQPLHASGRVTPRDPFGDAGGNLFIADTTRGKNHGRQRSLHSLWDGIITDSIRPDTAHSESAILTRTATRAMQLHPRGAFAAELGQQKLDDWAQASVRIAQQTVYRPPLVRGQVAPPAYRTTAYLAAEPRVALAGYRLADMLNQALGH